MSIDFSDLLDDDDDAVIHPRDIFFTLDKGPSFSFPRDIQTEVMNSWFDKRDAKDSVIKLNVGSGKTLVGLLLLQSSLNENCGPALYVTPDKQLAQQVLNEALELGLEVTNDPRDPAYEAGEKICVINIYKLFNGRSVFGVGGVGQRIGIGTVIVDDAHACVATVIEQFRIDLSNGHQAYKEIFEILKDDLKSYNESKYLDLEAGDPRAIMEVPFWAWHQNQSKILAALHKHREEDELVFTYPLIKESLQYCRCVIGGQKLEIEPPYPATDIIRSFSRAKRRIYMTATLSDDSVIATHFGANPDALGKPLVPSSSQSMGERMILMPQELSAAIGPKQVRTLLADLSKKHNTVVIVPSKSASAEWESIADQILVGDAVVPGVEKLKNGHVGLTVLVNRYDGIDLPGSACRILVIADLPEVTSYSEIVDGEVLSDSSQDLRRQIERIEQGMGRGVRSNDDYCAVLLVGSKLVGRIRSKAGQEILTPATRAQLELSRKIARKLATPKLKDIKSVILQCLGRDPNWIKVSKKALVNIEADEELRLDPSKIAIRRAFDFCRSNQFENAANALSKAANDSDETQEKAWLLSKKAAIQHNYDASGAQAALTAAHALDRAILKPLVGIKYKKLAPATGHQAAQLIENHSKRFLDATSMRLFANELCGDLKFVSTSADKFESTINELAAFLGIKGQRPEKDYNEGPDNLWALPNGKFLIIECKNGVTSESGISKKDAGQLGQSVEWFKKRYLSTDYTPVMIHPERFLGVGASAVADMVIIDDAGLKKLIKSIQDLAEMLVQTDISTSATEVGKALTQLNLNADAFIKVFGSELKSKK